MNTFNQHQIRFLLRKTSLFIFIALISLPAVTFASEQADTSLAVEVADGIKRLSSEASSLVTVPMQLENNNILLTLGIASAVGVTYIFDQDIQYGFQRNKKKSFDKAADAATLVGEPLIHLAIGALVYGSGIVADSRKWKETGEMIGEAIILADASTLIIKEASGRGRPNATSSKDDFKPFGFKKDFDSFPSMHTSSSFALASVLAATSENTAMQVLYYSAATFVGLSRAYNNKHWASDIVLGAALGELCGRIVTSHHASANKITFAPQFYENGVGLAMVHKW